MTALTDYSIWTAWNSISRGEPLTSARKGRDVPQDDEVAARLLARAAELGNAEATKQLVEDAVDTALTKTDKNARKRKQLQERGKAVGRNLDLLR